MKREIGIRMPNFSQFNFRFDFVYKKQKTEDKYRRVRFINGGFNVREIKGFRNTFHLAMAVGKEKRKPITNKIYWVQGLEFIGSINQSHSEPELQVNVNPALGIVLGFQYNINEKFRATLETIPSLGGSVGYNSISKKVDVRNLGFGFNSNAVSLNLLYAF
jgi:hypothetical protein